MTDDQGDAGTTRVQMEYSGVLAGGRRFHVTPERVEISDATGAVTETIVAREIASIRRHDAELTLTQADGSQVTLTAASVMGARRLAEILGHNAHLQVSQGDTQTVTQDELPRGLVALVVIAAVVVLAGVVLAMAAA